MAPIKLIVTVDVVKNDKLLELIAELINEYEFLLSLIPEWNNIEAQKQADKIVNLLKELIEIKQNG